MKKKIFLLAAIVVCIAIMAAGTLAYYTSESTAHNVITSGGIDIEVVNKTVTESGAKVDFPEEGITGIMPGTSVSKIVTVKNTGVSEAWIRIKLEAAIESADGEALDTDVMTYKILPGWKKVGDYYYYTKPVAALASTTQLIEEVVFNTSMGNEYQNCTANLFVSAEAVQKANNGSTVLEAKGWPETAK